MAGLPTNYRFGVDQTIVWERAVGDKRVGVNSCLVAYCHQNSVSIDTAL